MKDDTKEIKNLHINQAEIEDYFKTQIPLNNDAFNFFASHKDFCEEFLRILLRDDKLVVIENDIQKILHNLTSKDVYLDMLCRLSDNRLVNVEVQLYDDVDAAKRIFYYASKLLNETTEKGTKYENINDIIIIYLTKKDIFKKGSTLYNVKMDIVSDQGETVKEWAPGLEVIYINTEGKTIKEIYEYLKMFTDRTTLNEKYIVTNELKNKMINKGGLHMSKWIVDLMTKEREEGIEQGIEQGMEQGMQKGMQAMLDRLVSAGLINKEEAEKQLSLV